MVKEAAVYRIGETFLFMPFAMTSDGLQIASLPIIKLEKLKSGDAARALLAVLNESTPSTSTADAQRVYGELVSASGEASASAFERKADCIYARQSGKGASSLILQSTRNVGPGSYFEELRDEKIDSRIDSNSLVEDLLSAFAHCI